MVSTQSLVSTEPYHAARVAQTDLAGCKAELDAVLSELRAARDKMAGMESASSKNNSEVSKLQIQLREATDAVKLHQGAGRGGGASLGRWC